jgi:hypothetical protein
MPTEGSGGLVSLLKYNYFVVSVCKMSLEDTLYLKRKGTKIFSENDISYLCMHERPD